VKINKPGELYGDTSFGLLSEETLYKKAKTMYPEITKQQKAIFCKFDHSCDSSTNTQHNKFPD
jgi:hypothetical protein